jgi:hypothetical protein
MFESQSQILRISVAKSLEPSLTASELLIWIKKLLNLFGFLDDFVLSQVFLLSYTMAKRNPLAQLFFHLGEFGGPSTRRLLMLWGWEIRDSIGIFTTRPDILKADL